jgi:hypothetical protein
MNSKNFRKREMKHLSLSLCGYTQPDTSLEHNRGSWDAFAPSICAGGLKG